MLLSEAERILTDVLIERGCVWTQDTFGYWTCSGCGLEWWISEVEKDDLRYCPKCGARMTSFEHYEYDEEEDTDA